MQMNPPFSLKVELGPATGKIFDGTHLKRFTIGRTRGNSFQIKDNAISQKHLLVEWRNGQWIVEDLGSSNGTSINGINIDAGVPVAIYHDDLLRIGMDTRLRVVLRQEPVPNELPKERQSSRRRGSSQVQGLLPECYLEQTPCLDHVNSRAKQPRQRRDSAQPQKFFVFKEHTKQSCILKESSEIESRSRKKSVAHVQSLSRSYHANEPVRRNHPPKQEGDGKSRDMTLRQWFAQEMEDTPAYLTEKAEEIISEVKDHVEGLERAFMINFLSKHPKAREYV